MLGEEPGLEEDNADDVLPAALDEAALLGTVANVVGEPPP